MKDAENAQKDSALHPREEVWGSRREQGAAQSGVGEGSTPAGSFGQRSLAFLEGHLLSCRGRRQKSISY